MRKIIVQEWLSADGYAADKNGTTAFFEDRKWGEQSDDDLLKFIDSIDTILLGTNTYKMFLEFWPTEASEGEIIADKLNSIPKIVCSNSLQKVSWGKWDNATLLNGDTINEIKKLKSQNGKDIVLWGSIALVQSLLAAKLVDEIHIRTLPLLLGTGTPLFGDSHEIEMKTNKVFKYDSGLVLTELSFSKS